MTDWLMWLLEPLSFPFMQRAIIAAVITGAVCAVLSCYLVLKGWSLMGDAISHAVLPGIVLAYWIGIPLAIGAFSSGIFCAFATGYLRENSRIKEDTVMGIVFSGMFALGLVLFSQIDTDQHLSHILFGDMLGITQHELIQSLVIAASTMIIVLVKRRDLLVYCFDPLHAKVIGLPVRLLHYGLLSMLALTIVSSLQAVGVILVIAMLIAPGIIAFLLTRRFDSMIWIALAVSVFSSVAGTMISFYIDGASSACIVIVQAILFTLALIWSRIKIRRISQRNRALAEQELGRAGG